MLFLFNVIPGRLLHYYWWLFLEYLNIQKNFILFGGWGAENKENVKYINMVQKFLLVLVRVIYILVLILLLEVIGLRGLKMLGRVW